MKEYLRLSYEFEIEGAGQKRKVIVDLEDYPMLSRFPWALKKCNAGKIYAMASITFNGKFAGISMHRLIMGMRAQEVDHINRDTLDNRKENLRVASRAQNSWNIPRKPGKSGYVGVHWTGASWEARLTANRQRYRECGFKTAEDAARAYDELSKQHHGEFGYRNFKDKDAA